ncbi:MAG: biotin transporter BioY [Clostridia bacterium]|nr:biotin transporter BioY [Clostridia bacterium]
MKKLNMKSATRISAFAAIMAVCAWVWIPAPVPFTLQTFGVFLASGLLGAKRGTLSVLVYLLLGALGVPVFSAGRAGIGVLLGATGGFLTGFLPMAYVCGRLCQKFKRSPKTLTVSMLLGLLICYITGTLWYAGVYLGNLGAASIAAALMQCTLPFIVPDILKLILAVFCVSRLTKNTMLFPL